MYTRLEEIVAWCKKNNKLPISCDKDREIALMGVWLTQRKGDLKKGKLDKDIKIVIETKLKEFGFKWSQS